MLVACSGPLQSNASGQFRNVLVAGSQLALIGEEQVRSLVASPCTLAGVYFVVVFTGVWFCVDRCVFVRVDWCVVSCWLVNA